MTKAEKIGLQRAIGGRVCMAREIAGITQVELASRVGLTRGQITNIERGTTDTTATMIVRLGRVIGVKPGRLLP